MNLKHTQYLFVKISEKQSFNSKYNQIACLRCNTVLYEDNSDSVCLYSLSKILKPSCSYCQAVIKSDLNSVCFLNVHPENVTAFKTLCDAQGVEVILSNKKQAYEYYVRPIGWKKQNYIMLNISKVRSGITFDQINEISLNDVKALLFLDLDLTLTKKDKSISPLVVKILRKYSTKKLLNIVFCSGRPVTTLAFLARDLGFNSIAAIGSNGSNVVYMGKDKVIYGEYANSRAIINDVLRYIKEDYGLETLSEWTTSESADVCINDKTINVKQFSKILNTDPYILKIAQPIGGIECTDSGTGVIHLHGKNYTKGSAVKLLLEKTCFDKNYTAYIGNGLNDISACKEVNTPMAVQNACEEYKACCKRISDKTHGEGTLDLVNQFLIEKNILSVEQCNRILDEVIAQMCEEFDGYQRAQ